MKTLVLLLILFCNLSSLPSVANGEKGKVKPQTKAKTTPVATQTSFVTKMQAKWKSIRSYTASYTQNVTSLLLGTKDVTTGTVSVRKPNRFRWESDADGSLQLIRGNSLVLVQPKAQRGKTVVTTYKDIRTAMDPSFLKLLSGTLDLKAGFNVEQVGKTSKVMKLQLKSKKNPAESYLAEIDRKSYLLSGLSFQTEDSRTEIHFQKIRTNVKLPDSRFVYEAKSDDIKYSK